MFVECEIGAVFVTDFVDHEFLLLRHLQIISGDLYAMSKTLWSVLNEPCSKTVIFTVPYKASKNLPKPFYKTNHKRRFCNIRSSKAS